MRQTLGIRGGGPTLDIPTRAVAEFFWANKKRNSLKFALWHALHCTLQSEFFMSSFPLFPNMSVGPIATVIQKSPALVSERLAAISHLAEVRPASRLALRPAPEMVSSGIREIDALTGGLPRGCLTEVCGSPSSGRTSLLFASLAAATRRQETCALVDVSDVFDPVLAAAAEVGFEKLLWVRCDSQIENSQLSSRTHRGGSVGKKKSEARKNFARQQRETPLAQALRVTDLLLQSGGFGLVILDLGDVPFKITRRIPLTSWFRFQRTIEHTPTVLFVITQEPCAQTCASLLLKMQAQFLSGRPQAWGKKPSAFCPRLSAQDRNAPAGGERPGLHHVHEVSKKFPQVSGGFSHTELLEGLHIQTEVLRSRLERKPARSLTTAFTSQSVRAG
jgi:recA bacterial DNA recombination protein